MLDGTGGSFDADVRASRFSTQATHLHDCPRTELQRRPIFLTLKKDDRAQRMVYYQVFTSTGHAILLGLTHRRPVLARTRRPRSPRR